MKKSCRSTKKIIWMEWKLLTFTKDETRQNQPQRQVQRAPPKGPRSGYHLFLREQLDEMTGEDRKNYPSIVSKRCKEIKEDPARLSVYNDRAR